MSQTPRNTLQFCTPQQQNQPPPQQQPVPPHQYVAPALPTQYPYVWPQQPQQQQQPYGWCWAPPQPDVAPVSNSQPPQAPSRKRALEDDATEDEPQPPPKVGGPGRGRGRGGGANGGFLWGWMRMGHYHEKPTFPSCHAHKRAACAECYLWVPNR